MGGATALLPFLGASLGTQAGSSIAGGLSKILPGVTSEIMGPPAPLNLLSPEDITAMLTGGGQVDPGINLATNSNFVPVGSQVGPGPATITSGEATVPRSPESLALPGKIIGGLGGAGLGVGAAALLGSGTNRDRPPPVVSSSFTPQKIGPIAAPRLDFSTIGAPRGAIGVQRQRLLDLLRSRGLA